MILIFSTREFVIEDSVVRRDLPKIWSLFREMDFKARDCGLKFHKEMLFSVILKGVVSRNFPGASPRRPVGSGGLGGFSPPPNDLLKFADFESGKGCKSQGRKNEDLYIFEEATRIYQKCNIF